MKKDVPWRYDMVFSSTHEYVLALEISLVGTPAETSGLVTDRLKRGSMHGAPLTGILRATEQCSVLRLGTMQLG
jgi:hypothetical protein